MHFEIRGKTMIDLAIKLEEKLEHATNTAQGYNPLCGDRVTIYLNVGKDSRIADVRFEGKGCAISQASASLMTDMIVGKTVAEAEKLITSGAVKLEPSVMRRVSTPLVSSFPRTIVYCTPISFTRPPRSRTTECS